MTYLERLIAEHNPGYLWTLVDLEYGLQGLPYPRWAPPGGVSPGAITQATLLTAMGYHHLIPDSFTMPHHLSHKDKKGPVL